MAPSDYGCRITFVPLQHRGGGGGGGRGGGRRRGRGGGGGGGETQRSLKFQVQLIQRMFLGWMSTQFRAASLVKTSFLWVSCMKEKRFFIICFRGLGGFDISHNSSGGNKNEMTIISFKDPRYNKHPCAQKCRPLNTHIDPQQAMREDAGRRRGALSRSSLANGTGGGGRGNIPPGCNILKPAESLCCIGAATAANQNHPLGSKTGSN